MKKFFIACLLCYGGVIHAQSFKAGIVADGQLCQPNGMNHQAGFVIGAKGEMFFSKIPNHWFMDATLLFDAKNWKSDGYYNYDGTSQRWKYSTYSLTLPLNVGYQFRFTENWGIFTAAGPYLEIGLAGKSKVETSELKEGKVVDMTETKTSSDVFGDNVMNRFTGGVCGKVGLEIAHHYQISIGCRWGLSKIYEVILGNKQRTFTLGVGYIF